MFHTKYPNSTILGDYQRPDTTPRSHHRSFPRRVTKARATSRDTHLYMRRTWDCRLPFMLSRSPAALRVPQIHELVFFCFLFASIYVSVQLIPVLQHPHHFLVLCYFETLIFRTIKNYWHLLAALESIPWKKILIQNPHGGLSKTKHS